MDPSKTILVIDDEPDILNGYQAILEREGYRVITAPDGQSGLTRALREHYDLVIVDLMMPRISGFIILERVKEALPGRPVIMLTASRAAEQRAYAEFLGVDAYLIKPVAPQELVQTVERHCPRLSRTISSAADAVPSAS
jgi:DNA-binding response OmpR family regulator